MLQDSFRIYNVHKDDEVMKMTRLKWNKITSEQRIPRKQGTQDFRSLRSEIESDYHRIIRSASFRRLQDKTQVFPLDKSDFVRTRLTHSMEAASIAKLIGKQICVKIQDQKLEKEEEMPDPLKVIEALNCAGLLHDIGNPPFGHFGETAIRNWFMQNLEKRQFQGKPLSLYLSHQQMYDLQYYEGNAQALRIVTKLHRLVGDHGMHLTSGVMDAIIKYPTSSLEKHKEDALPKNKRNLLRKKIGYFQSEEAQFLEIKENTGCKNCRNPLAFILEAADDLAYTFADLEDGFNKGLYSYEELYTVIEQSEDEKGVANLARSLMDGKGLVSEKEKGFNPYQYAVFSWLTRKQLYCISQVSDAFIEHYEDIMQGVFDKELLAVSSQAALISNLKKFSYDKIYNVSPILKLELMGNEILTFLLDRFMDALIVYDTDMPRSEMQEKYIDLLSRNYLDNYHRSVKMIIDEGERLYHRLLLGCDFIAGMTDSYAKRLYQELRGI